MKSSEILVAARDIISDPKHWTQGYYALDMYGAHREAQSKDAVCFCSLGAVAKAAGRNTGVAHPNKGVELSYLIDAINREDVGDIVHFNDSHDHAEVLAAFDKAIQLAQKEGN